METTHTAERDVEGADPTLGGTAHVSDLLALMAVPAALWTAFALPAETRRDLALSHADPELAQTFLSHYVHLSAGHFLSNLGLYLLVAPLSYLLCAVAGRHREFRVAFVTYLLVFPFVLSGLNVLLARPTVGLGFSGIGMAFVGLLPWALFAYLQDRMPETFQTERAPALFFVGAVVIGTIVIPPNPLTMAGVAISSLGLVAYVGALVFRRSPRLPAQVRRAVATPGYLEIAAVSIVVFVGVAVLVFSMPAIQGGAVVNHYTHVVGYCLGFVVPYTVFDALGR
ncbi:hypothetical protein [Haloarchaeobius amylolyticus]|uniref:hypothetical protein n=1 Tax=Haloarchaeobius amylolyticus TaxID=1198296 RepID=UPI00226EA5B5|nr:hypothetical protein [Haloarchaeobius amylolyticus]